MLLGIKFLAALIALPYIVVDLFYHSYPKEYPFTEHNVTRDISLVCHSDHTLNNLMAPTSSQLAFENALSGLGCVTAETCFFSNIVSVYFCASPNSTLVRVQTCLLLLMAIYTSYVFLSINVGFFKFGVKAYRRQFLAVRRLDALVAKQIRVSKDEHDSATCSVRLPIL